jgi:hypothetical protein
MRKLEAAQALKWSSTRKTRQDIPFVRTAKAGNWKVALPESALEIIENAWGPLMRWLKYETVTSAGTDASGLALEAVIRG